MLKNYFLTTMRTLSKHKMYTLINVFGLALGLSCCILILLYTQYEQRFDHFHTQADRIYRVIREIHTDKHQFTARTSAPLAQALQDAFPEILHALRIRRDRAAIHYKQEKFRAQICIADKSIFDVFTFPLITSNPGIALSEPFSAVITPKLAEMLFKSSDPIGQIITVETKSFIGKADYTITGILADLPQTSTLRFDLLTATPGHGRPGGVWQGWKQSAWTPQETYILLNPNASPSSLESKFPEFITQHQGSDVQMDYHLQPLTRIHLHSKNDYGLNSGGNIHHVYQFSIIAFFILVIACVNFTNLATARSSNRSKEIGLRKVVGAHRPQLIRQFLGESMLLACIALIVALGLIELSLPKFNTFVQKDLSLFDTPNIFLILLGITFGTGFLSGIYPAFFLSSFKPAAILKGSQTTGSRRSRLRKGLVIYQFSIAIMLIVATLVVTGQVSYMTNKNLGYTPEQIVIVRPFTTKPALRQQYQTVKSAFQQHANVVDATVFHGRLGWGPYASETVRPEGKESESWKMMRLSADEDFLRVFDMNLVMGVNLSQNHPNSVLLNETAVKQLRWKNPIGKSFALGDMEGIVVGVVKDFHIRSLHEKIEPVFLTYSPNKFWYLALKIRSDNFQQTLAFLNKTWHRFIPEHELNWMFLTNGLWNKKYRSETRFSHMVIAFACIAITIACLGLFGLASFNAEQRKKEIGVRKVLGASVPNLLILLIKEHLILVAIANAIAWPIVYMLMQDWLEQFAYRIDIDLTLLFTSGLLALLIALITVIYQTLKATQTNPIETLHCE